MGVASKVFRLPVAALLSGLAALLGQAQAQGGDSNNCYDDNIASWSRGKKDMCCALYGVGCPDLFAMSGGTLDETIDRGVIPTTKATTETTTWRPQVLHPAVSQPMVLAGNGLPGVPAAAPAVPKPPPPPPVVTMATPTLPPWQRPQPVAPVTMAPPTVKPPWQPASVGLVTPVQRPASLPQVRTPAPPAPVSVPGQPAGVNIVTVPTFGTEGYDCEAGLSGWQQWWNNGKKQWCCQNKGVACPPTSTTTTLTTTSSTMTTTSSTRTTSTSTATTTTATFTSTTATTTVTTTVTETSSTTETVTVTTTLTTTQTFTNTSTETQTSTSTKTETQTVTSTETETKTSTTTVTTSTVTVTTTPFDCTVLYAWPQEKSDWCCANMKVGCPATSTTTSTATTTTVTTTTGTTTTRTSTTSTEDPASFWAHVAEAAKKRTTTTTEKEEDKEMEKEMMQEPEEDHSCPMTVRVRGAERIQGPRMGFFTQKAVKHDGRPVYENNNLQYIFYWAAFGGWRIGDSFTSPLAGVKSAPHEASRCPNEASDWVAYGGAGWVRGLEIEVSAATSSVEVVSAAEKLSDVPGRSAASLRGPGGRVQWPSLGSASMGCASVVGVLFVVVAVKRSKSRTQQSHLVGARCLECDDQGRGRGPAE